MGRTGADVVRQDAAGITTHTLVAKDLGSSCTPEGGCRRGGHPPVAVVVGLHEPTWARHRAIINFPSASLGACALDLGLMSRGHLVHVSRLLGIVQLRVMNT